MGINRVPLATNQGFKTVIVTNRDKVIPEYLAIVLTQIVPIMESRATGGTFKELSKSRFSELQIPLPQIDIQRRIVEQIESEQESVSANHKLEMWMSEKIRLTINRVWNIEG